MREDPPTPETQEEIRLDASVWQMMQGAPSRRVSTYDNAAALQAGTFKTYAYVDGSTDLYIDGSTVSYVTDHWEFNDGKHYWPLTGALNFFCHMPADLENTYCTFDKTAYANPGNLDGYSEDCPRIVCTGLPVTITSNSDDTQEMIYAYKANQSKAGQGASGVTMNFKHPFARVYFKISDASGTAVRINSVTIDDIYKSGTCTFDGSTTTWIPTGSQNNDLVITCSPVLSSANKSVGPFLVLPQTFATNRTFTVNATWTEWSLLENQEISASVNVGSWQPGYSYTYTFTLDQYTLKVETTSTYTEQW